MSLPAPGRVGRGQARARLYGHGETSWWDAVTMDDGVRRVLRLGPTGPESLDFAPDPAAPNAAWSGPLAGTLAEFLPLSDEPATDDAGLAAAVAAAAIRAGSCLGDGAALAERFVCVGGRWVLLGGAEAHPAGSIRLAELLLEVDATDSLALAALLAEPPPEAGRLLVRALATRLAEERHRLARRAANDRRADATARLRALASRLAGAAPPPAYVGPSASCDGRALRAGKELVFDGVQLDARGARALARSLRADPAAEPLRRWLRAMGQLRVDRALLSRSGP